MDEMIKDNPQIEVTLDLSTRQRQADFKLFLSFWEIVKTDRIDQIGHELVIRQVSPALIDAVTQYLYQRERPEFQFIDEEIENEFRKFDLRLKEFSHKLMSSASEQIWGNKKVFHPDYKSKFRSYTYEQENAARDMWIATESAFVDLEAAHKPLIRMLKGKFPEFKL